MKLTKIKLKIKGMVDLKCKNKLEEVLQELNGVESVNADYKTGKLILEYNLEQTVLKEIEPHIEDLGYHLPSNLFNKMQRALVYYKDEIGKENYLVDVGSKNRLNCCTLNKDKNFKKK